MKVWHITEAKNCKLLTSKLEVNSSTNEVVLSQDDDTFLVILPDEDFIKVKITKASISSSDVSSYLGNYGHFPIVPSRSCLAQVSESTFSSFKQGQRLFLSPYHANNNGTFKTRSIDLDGYLGDYAYVPIRDVYTLPEGICDSAATFIEDIALAINVLEELEPERGEYIAIYGASYINIIIAQLAIYYQAIPVVIDIDEDRLTLAQNAGIYYTINTRTEAAEQKIVEITSGKLCNYLVFDADCFTMLDNLLNFVKSEGKICLTGYNKFIPTLKCDVAKIIAKQLTIVGVNNGFGSIPSAINMLANKIVKTDNLIEHESSLTEYPDLLKTLSTKSNFYKSIINC